MLKYAFAVAALPLALTGCTAAKIVTAPIKAGAQVADWATTSQDEADRNYGRKMREKEEREGREAKRRAKQCRKDPSKCK